MQKEKVIVIIPSYNSAKTIESVCKSISKRYVNEIIVIDDGSTDQTLSILEKIGVTYITHKKNLGYGASQKSGYLKALKNGADLIIMLHSDGQHDPKYIPLLINTLKEENVDIVLGSRLKSFSFALKNKMPLYKIIFNKLLSQIANITLGLHLTEFHTGFRVYKRSVLEAINIRKLSNDFIFDQQILIAAHIFGFRLGEIYIPCIYTKDSSSISFLQSTKYGLENLINLFYYFFDKKKFK